MPDYRAKPHTSSAQDKGLNKKLAQCVGVPNPSKQELASVDSKDFDRGSGLTTQRVSSTVAVETSTAIVARDLSLIRSPTALPCLKKFLAASLRQASSQLIVRSVLVSRIPTPTPPGAIAAFGVRVRVAATIQRQTIAFFFDVRGSAVGQVELTVFTLGIQQPSRLR